MQKVKIIKDTIVSECVKKRFVSSCFPLAIMFYNECRKHKIDVKIIKGYGVFSPFAFRHYWIEIDGQQYDLRKDVYNKMDLNLPNYSNCEKLVDGDRLIIVSHGADEEQMSTYYDLIIVNGNPKFYFRDAPWKLRKLKSNISRKILMKLSR